MQVILAQVGVPVKRGHVYELLAASFGFKSYAAFSTVALLMIRGLARLSQPSAPKWLDRACNSATRKTKERRSMTELYPATPRGAPSYVEWRDIRAALVPSTLVEEDEAEDEGTISTTTGKMRPILMMVLTIHSERSGIQLQPASPPVD